MATEQGGAEMSGRTILIVDDNDDVRMSYVDLFGLMGFGNILEARNGQEGLEVYIRHMDEIDVVLTDLNMPLMNGAELFREIKRINLGRKRKARVVIATGNTKDDVISFLKSEGFDAILIKPAEIADIEREVCGLPN